MPIETQELILQMRRSHAEWGPRTLVHELARKGVKPVPSRSSVYRALVRLRMIDPVPRRRRRKDYRRWERDRSMSLWQFDVVKIKLIGDRKVSVVTGVDDHSRFCVSALVVKHASSTAVCRAFALALKRYGVPEDVLTDNGKVFTGRFSPRQTEVLFDRLCRDNGIRHILTAVRSPTTTGKIERFHKTLRIELFNKFTFPNIAEAQAALDRYIDQYNQSRPHQSLEMNVPAARFNVGEQHIKREPLPAPQSIERPEEFASLDKTNSIEASRKVNSSGAVSLANSLYNVGYRFRGKIVKIRFDRDIVHVFESDGETLIAAMPRKHVKEVKHLEANKYPARNRIG